MYELALPPETEVLDITPYGASLWTRTAEIKTKQADGSELSFFLKVYFFQNFNPKTECTNYNLKALKGDNGKTNSRGEFASMTALHAANPELTPQPIAVGTYDSDPSLHFFLCEFVDMTDDLPDLHNFPEALAKLHRNGVSPTGQFGFGVPTCMGNGRRFYTKWTDSWEEFFVNFFLDVVEYEQEVQGPDEEMAALTKQIVEKVIPRLCRPLETGGRSIKPLLIHGDLWDGNASVVVQTGQPVIYDAAAMYAHNECEMMSSIRQIGSLIVTVEFMTFVMARHKMNWPYIKEYIKFFPPSEPVEDFEDRLTLYGR